MAPSKIWQYFKRNKSNDSAKCLICDSVLMNNGSTSCLWAHFNAFHKNENNTPQLGSKRVHDDIEKSDSESTFLTDIASTSTDQSDTTLANTESSQSIQPYKRLKRTYNAKQKSDRPLNRERIEQITNSICEIITSGLLPFSFVENEGLKNLINLFEPNYKIPCRKTISTRIETLYELKLNKTKKYLERINSIALTTDGWSSLAIDSYIAYTGHYFDKDWTLCNVTLSIDEITESHTADKLKDDISISISVFEKQPII